MAPRLPGIGVEGTRRYGWLRIGLLWLALLALCGVPRSAAAHESALSVLSVDVGQERLDVLLDLDTRTLLDVLAYDDNDNAELEPRELDASAERLVQYIDTKLFIRNAGLACVADKADVELTNKRRVWIKRSYVCPNQPGGGRSRLGKLSVENSVFMEDRGGHRIVAKFVLGSRPVHHVFLPETTKFELDASDAPDAPGGRAHTPREGEPSGAAPQASGGAASGGDATFLGWVREGVKHIALGFDHIAFVLGLLVVVRRFRELALVVSAFTVAHSITLGLGATGLVRIEPRLVESMIAVSIVYVALDNYLGWRSGRFSDKQQRRHYLTFAFGLVHGFGFASVLTDLGLPRAGLLSALFGFNLGVELGQLAFVAPLFPLVQYLQRAPQRYAWTIRVSSALIGGLGLLWLLERVLDREFLPF